MVKVDLNKGLELRCIMTDRIKKRYYQLTVWLTINPSNDLWRRASRFPTRRVKVIDQELFHVLCVHLVYFIVYYASFSVDDDIGKRFISLWDWEYFEVQLGFHWSLSTSDNNYNFEFGWFLYSLDNITTMIAVFATNHHRSSYLLSSSWQIPLCLLHYTVFCVPFIFEIIISVSC